MNPISHRSIRSRRLAPHVLSFLALVALVAPSALRAEVEGVRLQFRPTGRKAVVYHTKSIVRTVVHGGGQSRAEVLRLRRTALYRARSIGTAHHLERSIVSCGGWVYRPGQEGGTRLDAGPDAVSVVTPSGEAVEGGSRRAGDDAFALTFPRRPVKPGHRWTLRTAPGPGQPTALTFQVSFDGWSEAYEEGKVARLSVRMNDSRVFRDPRKNERVGIDRACRGKILFSLAQGVTLESLFLYKSAWTFLDRGPGHRLIKTVKTRRRRKYGEPAAD